MVRFSSRDLPEHLKKRVTEAISKERPIPEISQRVKTPENQGSYFLATKPLSTNALFKGRRFKTKEYSEYRKKVGLMLPKIKVPEGKLDIHLEFGLSNSGADVDNVVKGFVDCLSETYGFNDNRVYHYDIKKVVVKKGEEYIKFSILPMN